jgi:CheY-like chemotaxis protein
VEDQWHVAHALKSLLEVEGMKVRGPASTAADALRLATEHKPDLAVVDINLKGGEMAYDLIDRLRDQGVRIVVVSGYALLPRLSGKAAAVLQKPFNGPELLGALRGALSP